MAEDVSYWICSCGKSNLKSVKKCVSCQKRRPRRWLLYGGLVVTALVTVAILSSPPEPPNETLSEQPDSQRAFLARIATAQDEAANAPNSLAFSDLLDLRDSQLTEISVVENWSGTVRGIQRMQGKGGVSIDIGGVTVLAGVHLTYGLDTLVSPSQSAVYSELLSLRRDDRVQFSGRFVIHNGSLVEMSYTGSGAVSTPEFLFEFSAIELIP